MNAYIFDVDGVIVDPQLHIISKPELVSQIIKILQKGDVIAFISGASVNRLNNKVIHVLDDYIKNNSFNYNLLDNVFISGEFGDVTITFSNGIKKEDVVLDKSFNEKVKKELIDISLRFSDVVTIDEYKQTQFTVVTRPDVPLEKFIEQERNIASLYRKAVKNLGFEEILEVHEDRIAINVKYKTSNKSRATNEFLKWLTYKSLKPDKFKAFGDAVSDLEIGHELWKNNLNFDFIYVGNPSDIKHNINFPIISTLQKFGKETDEGTLEYLKQE